MYWHLILICMGSSFYFSGQNQHNKYNTKFCSLQCVLNNNNPCSVKSLTVQASGGLSCANVPYSLERLQVVARKVPSCASTWKSVMYQCNVPYSVTSDQCSSACIVGAYMCPTNVHFLWKSVFLFFKSTPLEKVILTNISVLPIANHWHCVDHLAYV